MFESRALFQPSCYHYLVTYVCHHKAYIGQWRIGTKQAQYLSNPTVQRSRLIPHSTDRSLLRLRRRTRVRTPYVVKKYVCYVYIYSMFVLCSQRTSIGDRLQRSCTDYAYPQP